MIKRAYSIEVDFFSGTIEGSIRFEMAEVMGMARAGISILKAKKNIGGVEWHGDGVYLRCYPGPDIAYGTVTVRRINL